MLQLTITRSRALWLIAAVAAFVLQSATVGTVAAGVYKWTDPDGRVHYSDKAPSRDAAGVSRVETESAKSPGTSPDASESESSVVEQWEKVWQQRQKAREESEREEKERRATKERQRRSEACEKARAVVRFLEDHRNSTVYRRDERHPEVTSASSLAKHEIRNELEKWQAIVDRECTGDEPTGVRSYAPKELPFAAPGG